MSWLLKKQTNPKTKTITDAVLLVLFWKREPEPRGRADFRKLFGEGGCALKTASNSEYFYIPSSGSFAPRGQASQPTPWAHWTCSPFGEKPGKAEVKMEKPSWVIVGRGGWIWQTWESSPAASRLVSVQQLPQSGASNGKIAVHSTRFITWMLCSFLKEPFSWGG